MIIMIIIIKNSDYGIIPVVNADSDLLQGI